MTGEDAAGGLPADGSDDEAVWRDLVARFDAPVIEGASVPWPEREDLAGERSAGREAGQSRPARADTLPGLDPVPDMPLPDRGSPSPADTATFSPVPGHQVPRPSAPVPEDEDHFVPPPPPPFPKLDPVTKGAWAALFGGPAYLLLATAAGWSVPGIAAFVAVAAFIGGFAVLVLRMDDGPPRDSGPDDGAVV